MGRHNSNTVEYFPHYIGDGKKIFTLEKIFGNDGYATWFKILEKMAQTENHYLDLNDTGELIYLSAKCNVNEERLLSIIDLLVKLEVFEPTLWRDRILYNHQFMKSIEDAYKRRTLKCMQFDDLCLHLFKKGIHKSYNKSEIASKSTQRKGKEKKGKEIYREFNHLSLTIVEFERLKEDGYTQHQIDTILDKIQNYKKNVNYVSLNLTARDWLKKEHTSDQAVKQDATPEQQTLIDNFFNRPTPTK